MYLKNAIALAAALSLSASPAIAAAAPRAPVAQPAAETIEGSEMYRTGIIVPLVGIFVLALIIYLVIDSQKDDEDPISP